MKVTRIRVVAYLLNVLLALGAAYLIASVPNLFLILMLCVVGGTALGFGTVWILGKETSPR